VLSFEKYDILAVKTIGETGSIHPGILISGHLRVKMLLVLATVLMEKLVM
jgi:hypothetical protein